jgi:hypothetical protein
MAPLAEPVKVKPPPERLSALLAGSYVPLNVVVLPPATCTLPVAPTDCASSVATSGQKIERDALAIWDWMVTVSVPVWPVVPAIVP